MSRAADGFVVALDIQTGALRWLTSLATSGTDVATTVVADRSTVLVGGATSGAFAGSSNGGLDDAFVARLSATTGVVEAVEQFGSAAADAAFGSAFDGRSVFVAGSTGGTLFSTSLGELDAWWAAMTSP